MLIAVQKYFKLDDVEVSSISIYNTGHNTSLLSIMPGIMRWDACERIQVKKKN